MAFDNHQNFAYALVATAPSPATSGTSLVVTSGLGSTLGTPPFNMVVWAAPTGNAPISSNAEIVRVTNISTDTLTIVRAQEGSSARTILVGDQIASTMTAKTFTDIEASLPFGVKYYGAKGDGSTDDTGAIQAAVNAAGVSGGVVFFPQGTYKVSSSGRKDTGVSYSTGTWTDSSIVSGDVGAYVMGSGASQGLTPKITSVVSGTSFTTDVAPGGVVSSAAVTIMKPAIDLPPGVRLQGIGPDYGSQSSPSPSSLINDVGAGGVTCFIRGLGGNTDRYGIFDLGIHGAGTGTSTTLYGIYTGDQTWFVDIIRCNISYHGVADIALDGNVNNINIDSCMFIDGGYSGATIPTGGIVMHPNWRQPSSAVQIYNSFFVACFGFGIADGDSEGAYGLVVWNTQFNSIQTTAATNSGTSMVLQSHGENDGSTNGQAMVIGGWSETAANLDLITSGNVVVQGLQLYSNHSYHWLVNAGTAVAIGCYFGQASTASIHLSGGNINWSSIHCDDPAFYSGAPSPLGAFGSSDTSLYIGANLSGVLPLSNGGTGSATQNFVDLTTTQASIGGLKTFTNNSTIFAGGAFKVQNNLPISGGIPGLGGYYSGVGIGGTTHSGNPMFGVLNDVQSGNGLGSTAFTVIDNNKVYTFNNTLDDGSGNMTLGGNLTLPLTMKFNIATGSNASAGTGTLSGGTVTISTTAVTASSLIFLTDTASSITNVGSLTVSAKTAGTSFVVTSTLALDTSTFNWLIIN